MAKLDDNRIAWIIKSKSQARLTNRDIADAANVSISSCTEYTKEATAYQNSKNLVEREKKSAKRKELLSISYMVYTRLMHAISKRYFLPMVIASIIIGFTGYLSRRVWH
jgi:restriction endonuclease